MSGAGIQAAGASSAGFGTSTAATVQEGAFLRDTRTSKKLGARKIDPNTRDYVLDTNGRILGMNEVQHAVQMSIHTDLGSAAVQSMGQKLRTIKRITPGIEREILAILSAAVQPLVAQGLIEVVGFTHFVAGDDRNGLQRGAVYGRFKWRDLTTTQVHEELV